MPSDKIVINTDGVSRGNPGAAAIGAVIRDGRGRILDTLSLRIGHATNNQAEYRAVIAALEKALALGVIRVELHSDSELVVRLKELEKLLEAFTILHIPRRQNKEADKLANAAIR
jgi:ribonuclease HI